MNGGISPYTTTNEAGDIIFDYLDWYPDIIDFNTEKHLGVRRAVNTTHAEEFLGLGPKYTLEVDIYPDWTGNSRPVAANP